MRRFFPFDNIRNVQDDIVRDLRDGIKEGKNFVIHAPAGTGKTAASLAPALEYGLEKGKSVFFLTPKHTQHKIAVETLKKIQEKHGINVSCVDFIGKKWMCPVPGIDSLSSSDFASYCRDMKKEEKCDFYNNVRDGGELTKKAKKEVQRLKKTGPMNVEKLSEECKDKDFCPYELACNLAKVSDVIIADYYHLFHPHVRDSFLIKTDKELEDSIVIVDEAQNLPDRIRNVLSNKLSTFMLRNASEEAGENGFEELADDISEFLEIFKERIKDKLGSEDEAYVKKEDLISIVELVRDYEEFYSELILVGDEIREEQKKSYVGSLGSFLEEWEKDKGEGYVRIASKDSWKGNLNFSVSIKCLDPSVTSSDVFNESYSSIIMSATLLPTKMYRDSLGMSKDRTLLKEYPDPFPSENRLSLIVPETTTKYKRRGDEEYEKIASWCAKMSNAIEGNSAIFFPSYKIKDEISTRFADMSSKTIFGEEKGMSKRQRMNLLSNFKDYSDEGAVFMGAAGGSFGEGIDLPGKFLNGVIVAGIPLARPDLETKSLIDFYEDKFGSGWSYGYTYPAMNRVIQACGRAIRSKKDKGVVVLLDERYVWSNYFKSIPKEWGVEVTKRPTKKIRKFFNH